MGKGQDLKRWRVLYFILLFSLLNQWTRWLPVYLSSVSMNECTSICDQVSFTPLCQSCGDDDYACSLCHECRVTHNSAFYNLEDGVCMTTVQYGIISGVGFASMGLTLTGARNWRCRAVRLHLQSVSRVRVHPSTGSTHPRAWDRRYCTDPLHLHSVPTSSVASAPFSYRRAFFLRTGRPTRPAPSLTAPY
jgi:hypothetical protein